MSKITLRVYLLIIKHIYFSDSSSMFKREAKELMHDLRLKLNEE
jgi:hypothetical protein